MADVETNKETPVQGTEGSGNTDKDLAKIPPSQFAIYDVTARGAVKTLHEAAERGKVKDVTTFLSKMKNTSEVSLPF